MLITIYCMPKKGKMNYHLVFDVGNEIEDFDISKERILNNFNSMGEWFKKLDDEFTEWEGLFEEIEKQKHINKSEFRFSVNDEKEREKLYSVLKENGYSYMILDADQVDNDGVSQLLEEDISKQYERAYELYEEEKYDEALKAFDEIKYNYGPAMYMIGLIYAYDDNEIEYMENIEKALNCFLECERMDCEGACFQVALCMYRLGDCDGAFRYAEKSHQLGDEYGSILLSDFYLEGVGCERNVNRAKEILMGLVKKGTNNEEAYEKLGSIYERLDDYNKAFKVYKDGADNTGSFLCKYKIAKFYECGKGTKKNEYEAFILMKKLAKEGDIDAMEDVFDYYEGEIGTIRDEEAMLKIAEALIEEDVDNQWKYKAFIYRREEDYEELERLYEKEIQDGNDYFKFSLGLLYIELNRYKEALLVLESGLATVSEYDEIEAEILTSIGLCYTQNDSEIKNNKKAKEYFKRAADLGCTDAMMEMYEICYNDENFDKAYSYLKMAANKGCVEAQEILSKDMYDTGDIDSAIKMCKELIKKKSDFARLLLGKCLIEKGKYGEAKEMLEQAAQKGIKEAYIYLYYIYSHSNYIGKNKEQAIEILRKGAEADCGNCKKQLALYYLYDETYNCEEKGIELLRDIISKTNDIEAKNIIVVYYYEKYERAISKVSIFDSECSGGGLVVSTVLPIFGLVGTLVSSVNLFSGHIKYRKITKRKRNQLDSNDMIAIKELVKYMLQLIKSNEFDENKKRDLKKKYNKIHEDFLM